MPCKKFAIPSLAGIPLQLASKYAGFGVTERNSSKGGVFMIKTKKEVKKMKQLYTVTARIESLNFQLSNVQTKASLEQLHAHAEQFNPHAFYLFVKYNGLYHYSIYLDEQKTIFVFDITHKEQSFKL